jgi:collagenase-like PrtC family protease
MSGPRLELTLGPLLFNWSPDAIRSFYRTIAERGEIDRVYLGEVVCGKRAPLLEAALADAAEMLAQAGKEVVWSAPSLPATPRERRGARDLIASVGLVELNDLSGLLHLPAGGRFVAGPFLNIYNESAAEELVRRGCRRLCANIELPLDAIARIGRACPGVEIEVFGFGRLPLALSGRCHHARLHGLHKDACQFVCTVEGEPFLAMNGVLTMSHGVQVIDAESQALRAAGVTAIRLSPHTGDMIGTINAFRRFAEGAASAADLRAAIPADNRPGPLVGGYLAGAEGMRLAGAA